MGWTDGLTFGWRTAILTVAVVQQLVMAAALLSVLENRVANRTLAVLLVVLAGTVTPWMIGFAGFYDKWRWLTFAPFQITLAVAPLLYFHVHALLFGHWPRRWMLHLTPPLFQFGFLAISFALPIDIKDAWADASHTIFSAVTSVGVVAGLGAYGVVGLRLLARYRAFVAGQRADDHRFAARWLSRALGGMLALLPVWLGYVLWDWIDPLGYTGLMGLYVAIAAVALFLGIEGWRHAERPFPRLADAVQPDPVPARDWRALGERWVGEVRANRWHADADLSLATLARRLGTNTNFLSRALNEGLGVNFSTLINRLRSEAVAEAIRSGRGGDLLDLALEAGFSSKASFNRAFLSAHGMTPSAYRRQHVSKAE